MNRYRAEAARLYGYLAGDFSRWMSYKEGENDFSVDINASKKIVHPWKTTYETKVTQKCFSTSVEVNVDTSRIISDIHYNLKYKAVGLNSYNIERGKWYRSAYVDPSVQFYPAAGVNTYRIERGRWFDSGFVNTSVRLMESDMRETFFGKNGSLHPNPFKHPLTFSINFILLFSNKHSGVTFGT